jgi:hypothetical protein
MKGEVKVEMQINFEHPINQEIASQLNSFPGGQCKLAVLFGFPEFLLREH